MKWNGQSAEERAAWAEVSRAYRDWRQDGTPECAMRFQKVKRVARRVREAVRCRVRSAVPAVE